MVKFEDFRPDMGIRDLAGMIKNELIQPYIGKEMPQEAKEIIRKIFTDERFRKKIYRMPLNGGTQDTSAWSRVLVRVLGKVGQDIVLQVLNNT